MRTCCQAVSDGDIDVKPGGGSDAAYDSRLNTIFTQNGNPPLNVADRAQLLHECTHAIFDAYGWVTNLREDEVAAYLAQLTFMFIVNPISVPAPYRTHRQTLCRSHLWICRRHREVPPS